jgi:hypothetical protein
MSFRDIAKPVGMAVAGVAGEAFLTFLATVDESHRNQAHRSLELDRWLSIGLKTYLYPYNDPSSWAAVHRGLHHGVTDADLQPFVALADYTDWRSDNQRQAKNHPIPPEAFNNFDYTARNIAFDTAYTIGTKARELVDGLYTPNTGYSLREATNIFDDSRPRYQYQDIRKSNPRHTKIPDSDKRTLEDVHYRLRDPHAPVLHPEGVKGVFKDNYWLYVAADQQFNRDGLPDDLKRSPTEQRLSELRNKMLVAEIGAHVALPAIYALAKGRGLKAAALYGLAGGAVVSAKAKAILRGGAAVNSIGHSGQHPGEAWRTGVITPYPDGTFATDNKALWGLLTFDEGNRQKNHHEHPDWIAYGRTAAEAPFGKATEWMASHSLGMDHGPGFPDQASRPDLPHPAVVMLQEERVRTIIEKTLLTV